MREALCDLKLVFFVPTCSRLCHRASELAWSSPRSPLCLKTSLSTALNTANPITHRTRLAARLSSRRVPAQKPSLLGGGRTLDAYISLCPQPHFHLFFCLFDAIQGRALKLCVEEPQKRRRASPLPAGGRKCQDGSAPHVPPAPLLCHQEQQAARREDAG